MLLFGAFRYAFGRQAYFVGMACDLLCAYVPLLGVDVQQKFINDLGKLLKNNNVGAAIDRQSWLELLERLKEEYCKCLDPLRQGQR